MIPEDLDYRYDRRIDAPFLELFDRRGVFRTVTEYARKARYPIDLQFRRHVPSGAQHASLYVGLSTVLDVHWKPGKVRLAAHKTFQDEAPFDAAWQAWADLLIAERWIPNVEAYLDTIIPIAAAGRAAVEGSVQAAVSSFGSSKRVMLDREVMLHFRNIATKKRVMDEVTSDLLAAVQDVPIPGARPSSFGGKCDLLSVDGRGRLLAIEVKPRRVSSIVWAPAQAIVYARLFNRWLGEDPDAATILAGMLKQRKQLKLAGPSTSSAISQSDVIPTVAVQRGMTDEYRRRLFAVQSHLADRGIKEANSVEVFEVTLAGRLISAGQPA
jgi:hypothetical protein